MCLLVYSTYQPFWEWCDTDIILNQDGSYLSLKIPWMSQTFHKVSIGILRIRLPGIYANQYSKNICDIDILVFKTKNTC